MTRSAALKLIQDLPDAVLLPPLKWAGGKRWLVPTLQKLWQPHSHRRLVEPFVGGLAVALGLQPQRALLNDNNEHLINFFIWLQRGLVIELEMKNSRTMYYRYRERFNKLIACGNSHSREAAELFYYLNRTCYNGLCRFSRTNRFNVPFGKYSAITYESDFLAYRAALKNWHFTSVDFAELRLEPGDFVYADPPYDVEFTSYSANGFTWDDQLRLAIWLASHTGPVVASNQATPRICRLYRDLGFEVKTISGPRRISCNGDRTPALELLATKGL
jgi:DNA adenine methylase